MQWDQNGATGGAVWTTFVTLQNVTASSLTLANFLPDYPPDGGQIPTISFNGDSKSDILWQNDNGMPAAWLMDGTNATSASAAGSFNPGPTWHVKDTGDFDDNGKSDILWQSDNGTAAIWLMDGTNATFVGTVGAFNPGPSWEIKGTGDFNDDGKSDIL